MPRHVSVDLDELRRLHAEGWTAAGIAREFSVNQQTIRSRLRALGLPSHIDNYRLGDRVLIDENDLRACYDSGESVLSMANRFGTDRNTIARRLQRLGLTSRTGSEANVLRFQKMTPDERRDLTRQAHRALRVTTERDVPASEGRRWLGDHLAEKTRRRMESAAMGRGLNLSVAQPHEDAVISLLEPFKVIRQAPVGTYNLDALIDLVAVEIHASTVTYERSRRLATRSVQLLDSGYSVLVVWIDRGVPERDDLIAEVEMLRRNHATTRQYRVVRRDMEPYSVSRDELNRWALPPRPSD